jgi:rSAM/selenodomain-associated transferase 2
LTEQLTLSVVIPVLDDTDALGALLESLRSAPNRPDEIVVVDGGNSDECLALTRRYPCKYLRTRPGRGHQLDAGAKCAGGDIIWFLHADASPAASAVTSIHETISAGAIGGYFRFRFAGECTWYKRMLASLINWRARIGIPYGDQAPFFRKAGYLELGGFSDVPLFEEVTLIKAARRTGRFAEIPMWVGVSARRWERDGWFRRTLENRLLALGYMLGISPRTLANRYRQ